MYIRPCNIHRPLCNISFPSDRRLCTDALQNVYEHTTFRLRSSPFEILMIPCCSSKGPAPSGTSEYRCLPNCLRHRQFRRTDAFWHTGSRRPLARSCKDALKLVYVKTLISSSAVYRCVYGFIEAHYLQYPV